MRNRVYTARALGFFVEAAGLALDQIGFDPAGDCGEDFRRALVLESTYLSNIGGLELLGQLSEYIAPIDPSAASSACSSRCASNSSAARDGPPGDLAQRSLFTLEAYELHLLGANVLAQFGEHRAGLAAKLANRGRT